MDTSDSTSSLSYGLEDSNICLKQLVAIATNPSSSSTTFPFASNSCVILFLALLCFVSAWKIFVFLSHSLSHKTRLFCFQNISSALRASESFFNASVIYSVEASSFEHKPFTLSLSSSTSFAEFTLCCFLHSLKAFWQLEICSMIFAIGSRIGDIHPSRMTCRSSLLSSHLLSNLNFFYFLAGFVRMSARIGRSSDPHNLIYFIAKWGNFSC